LLASGESANLDAMSRLCLVLPVIVVSACLPAGNVHAADDGETIPFTADGKGYLEIAVPYLKTHCISCHGPKKEKGELRVDNHLQNDFLDGRTAERWGEVLDAVNSHEMPPEDEPQPETADAARFADWVTEQLGRAELAKKGARVVLRRLNRIEYANTIRDLIGIDFDTSGFPEDPPAGGFDNIGEALTLSPLHLELYFDAARTILDKALVTGEQPAAMKWRFEPEDDPEGGDRTRVERDGQRIILNKGKIEAENGTAVMRVNSWDKNINFRDFRLPHEGEYVIRIRASSRVPDRAAVVAGAEIFLRERAEKEAEKNPERRDRILADVEENLEHFRTDPMYGYGPPRIRIIRDLGGQPTPVATFDIDAPSPEAKIFEFRTFFTTEKAGVTLEYAYDIPKVLENFWCQGQDGFARPEALVDWIEIEGPVYDQWPPESHMRLVGNALPEAGAEKAAARGVLARLMPLAWRHPVTDAEINGKLALFENVRPMKDTYLEAIKIPLVAVLTSPSFLYLGEPLPEESGNSRPLDDYELATRLSYFLCSTMPDAPLRALAEKGGLRKPGTLEKEIDRLLADPKGDALCVNFASQWLDLRKIGANPPSENLYPRYDRHLEMSIREESIAFFREILLHDLPVANFIRSDFVTINERLGRFYGIPGVRGDVFRKVAVKPEFHRGGIVTQASVLSVTSNGTRTSPVVRGAWILRNVLGTDPGLPVANAGEIQPKVPGIDKATVRQRLEIHRTAAQCARCHDKIDPIGFSLENYNAAGEWRDKEGFGYNGRIGRDDPDIDASAKLPDGTEFTGVGGLQDAMLAREGLFLDCLARKMFLYALGRELGYSDKPHVDKLVATMKKEGRTLRTLICAIVSSEPFLHK
jgi:mono/diheme cytochrome c family protein